MARSFGSQESDRQLIRNRFDRSCIYRVAENASLCVVLSFDRIWMLVVRFLGECLVLLRCVFDDPQAAAAMVLVAAPIRNRIWSHSRAEKRDHIGFGSGIYSNPTFSLPQNRKPVVTQSVANSCGGLHWIDDGERSLVEMATAKKGSAPLGCEPAGPGAIG